MRFEFCALSSVCQLGLQNYQNEFRQLTLRGICSHVALGQKDVPSIQIVRRPDILDRMVLASTENGVFLEGAVFGGHGVVDDLLVDLRLDHVAMVLLYLFQLAHYNKTILFYF